MSPQHYTVSALIMRLSNSASKINFKKLSNRVSHTGDPVSIVASLTFVTLGGSMDSFSVPEIIHGYHVYQQLRTPHVGEKATTAGEPGNEHERYAVAMLEAAYWDP